MSTFANNQYIYLLITLFIISGCKKTEATKPLPKAAFSFDIANAGRLPTSVNFTSTSSNAEVYQWKFDDGNTSTAKDPIHTFAIAGTYNVKLLVSNSAGKDSIIKQVVIILKKPAADFSFAVSNDGSMPCTVNFTNTSIGGETHTWDFGNGVSSTIDNPLNIYNESKTFNVKLVVSNASGKDSIIKQIKIKKIDYSVRIFLITPTDRTFSQQYLNAIKMCAVNLQNYYKQQMGSKTFTLNNPMIDTLQGLHTYNWYNQYNGTFSGTDPRFYGYFNTLYELQQVIGSDLNTSLYMNAVYVAAPGGGAGSPGLCALGDQDLDGLLGVNPTNPDINRWIGGSGHEWGHGFGLNHPTDPAAPPALMGPGLYAYPNCVLLPADKTILNASPFFK